MFEENELNEVYATIVTENVDWEDLEDQLVRLFAKNDTDELRTWSAADCRYDRMINIGTELERQLEKERSKRRPDNDHHGDRQLRPVPPTSDRQPQTQPRANTEQATSGTSNRRLEPMCYNCRQPGHVKRDCPKPQKTIVCYTCKQEGHKASDCKAPSTRGAEASAGQQ